jgi:hypothetical protein
MRPIRPVRRFCPRDSDRLSSVAAGRDSELRDAYELEAVAGHGSSGDNLGEGQRSEDKTGTLTDQPGVSRRRKEEAGMGKAGCHCPADSYQWAAGWDIQAAAASESLRQAVALDNLVLDNHVLDNPVHVAAAVQDMPVHSVAASGNPRHMAAASDKPRHAAAAWVSCNRRRGRTEAGAEPVIPGHLWRRPGQDEMPEVHAPSCWVVPAAPPPPRGSCRPSASSPRALETYLTRCSGWRARRYRSSLIMSIAMDRTACC